LTNRDGFNEVRAVRVLMASIFAAALLVLEFGGVMPEFLERKAIFISFFLSLGALLFSFAQPRKYRRMAQLICVVVMALCVIIVTRIWGA
jgi:hypothetical protein